MSKNSRDTTNRLVIRIDKRISKLIAIWNYDKEVRIKTHDGKPMSISKQCAVLMRCTLRKYMQGEISKEEIKAYGKISGEAQGMYRVDLPANLIVLAKGLLGEHVSMPEIFRASVRFFYDVTERHKLEAEYVKKGGVGDPLLMSDDFLFLWNKFNKEGPVQDGIRIVRALRDLELKFQVAVEKLDTLNTLFYRYGIEGVLNSDLPPMRKELDAMDRKALNAVATRWGIQVPRKSNEDIVRRLVITHFGYSRD